MVQCDGASVRPSTSDLTFRLSNRRTGPSHAAPSSPRTAHDDFVVECANQGLPNSQGIRVELGVGSWGLGVRRIKFVTPMRALVPITLSIVTLLTACGRGSDPATAPQQDWFVDRSKETGLNFVHINGMSGKLYVSEVLAPGVALFDYDNDGDLDVFLVQGSRLLALGSGNDAPGSGSRLFRNDLTIANDGARTLRFTDVTSQSGIVTYGYGMGVAAGDFNNDGWVDLYLTKFDAANQLLRNDGNGTFTDVARASGTDHRSWSVSASFVDIDRDGWLDLYVTNYLRYSLASNPPCYNASGVVGYCTPDSFDGLADRLYRNQGDGTFADVSLSSGVAREQRPGLGVTAADFNRDGWADIYVANDGRENLLWVNRGNGAFEDGALLAGVALDRKSTRLNSSHR